METRGSDIHESIIALTGDNFQRSPDPKRRLGRLTLRLGNCHAHIFASAPLPSPCCVTA
jgi:hypothetical protein